MSGVRPPALWRLVAFAAGDFGFNLYWQSATLYLLFYYTEVAHLSILMAASIYLIASIWDGVINLLVGLWIDQYPHAARLRRLLIWGALPLGGSFVALYQNWDPALPGRAMLFLLANIAFRAAYALVNIPYLTLSARISDDPAARATLSGMRIVAGIAAAVIVAHATVPAGLWLAHGAQAQSYVRVALLYAVPASLLIMAVGTMVPYGAPHGAEAPAKLMQAFCVAMSNRAFTVLMVAMMAMTIASSALGKMVLYDFKYELNNETAGQDALTYMALASAVAVPIWVVVCRRVGTRMVWLVAALLAVLILGIMEVWRAQPPALVQLSLVLLQCVCAGFNFCLWAMLPEVSDFGRARTGLSQEGMYYGLNALLQRIAIGLGTLILGTSMSAIGFRPDATLSAATRDGLHQILVLLPAIFFGLSGAAMLFSPLVRPVAARKPR